MFLFSHILVENIFFSYNTLYVAITSEELYTNLASKICCVVLYDYNRISAIYVNTGNGHLAWIRAPRRVRPDGCVQL